MVTAASLLVKITSWSAQEHPLPLPTSRRKLSVDTHSRSFPGHSSNVCVPMGQCFWYIHVKLFLCHCQLKGTPSLLCNVPVPGTCFAQSGGRVLMANFQENTAHLNLNDATPQMVWNQECFTLVQKDVRNMRAHPREFTSSDYWGHVSLWTPPQLARMSG